MQTFRKLPMHSPKINDARTSISFLLFKSLPNFSTLTYILIGNIFLVRKEWRKEVWIPKLKKIVEESDRKIYRKFHLFRVFTREGKIYLQEKSFSGIGIWIEKNRKYYLLKEARYFGEAIKKIPESVKETYEKAKRMLLLENRDLCGFYFPFSFVFESTLTGAVVINWEAVKDCKADLKRLKGFEKPFKDYPFFTETLIHELTHHLYKSHGKPFQALFYRFLNAVKGTDRKVYNFCLTLTSQKEVLEETVKRLEDLWEVSCYLSGKRNGLYSLLIIGRLTYLERVFSRIPDGICLSSGFSYLVIPRVKEGVRPLPLFIEHLIEEIL